MTTNRICWRAGTLRQRRSPPPISAPRRGLPRILALLDKYNIPSTFFIAAVSALLHPEMIPAIMKSGRHEIRVHGWIHEFPPATGSADEEERLLNQAVEYLTKATGK